MSLSFILISKTKKILIINYLKNSQALKCWKSISLILKNKSYGPSWENFHIEKPKMTPNKFFKKLFLPICFKYIKNVKQ